MRAIRLVLMAVLMAVPGCNAWRGVFPGSPDYVAPSGPQVYLDGQRGDPETVVALECMYSRIHEMCPSALLPEAKHAWRDLKVHWEADPFDCWGYQVHGCVAALDEIHVSSLATVVEESAHVAWHACGRGWGEEEPPDAGRVFYHEDFVRWYEPCRK
jgi:hypothetical protein